MTDHDRTGSNDASVDAEYSALLAELSAPHASVDWSVLNARIADAAELPLARLRAAHAGPAAAVSRVTVVHHDAWWAFASRRARALLPLAMAASLAMFAYAQLHPVDVEGASVDALDAYASAVAGSASSTRVTSLLVGSAGEQATVAPALR